MPTGQCNRDAEHNRTSYYWVFGFTTNLIPDILLFKYSDAG